MCSRYDQQLYDMFGDGPSFKNIYTNDERLCEGFRSRGILESQWAAELDKLDAVVDAQLDKAGG